MNTSSKFKKVLYTTIASLGLAIVGTSFAQSDTSGEIKNKKLTIQCADMDTIIKKVFSEWGESPTLVGKSVRANGAIRHDMILTINHITMTWSLLEVDPKSDMICLIATGDNLEELFKGNGV